MSKKYLENDELKTHEVVSFMALLYSVENEIVHSYIKSLKASNKELYRKLTRVDDELNNKKLFAKLVDF